MLQLYKCYFSFSEKGRILNIIRSINIKNYILSNRNNLLMSYVTQICQTFISRNVSVTLRRRDTKDTLTEI